MLTIGEDFCPEGGGLESHRERCNVLSPRGGRSEAKWKGIFPSQNHGERGVEYKVERERSLTNILNIFGPSIANFNVPAFFCENPWLQIACNAREKMTISVHADHRLTCSILSPGDLHIYICSFVHIHMPICSYLHMILENKTCDPASAGFFEGRQVWEVRFERTCLVGFMRRLT